VMARSGFALAATLLALLLIAALVAGVVFAALEETRIGAAAASKERFLGAAESAIEATSASLVREPNRQIGIAGSTRTTTDWSGVDVSVTTTRLDSAIYWLVARAPLTQSSQTATRQIGVLLAMTIVHDSSGTTGRTLRRWWSEVF
jgi:Tfp pilus assembly protein PilX